MRFQHPHNVQGVKQAIFMIVAKCPTAVFGGSIALNAVGLLDRPSKDIDVFLPQGGSLAKSGFLNIETTEFLSETTTDTNGKKIQRVGAEIAGIKCCVFKVDDEELQHSLAELEGVTLRVQNVNYAILAKMSYADRSGKHQKDLSTIFKTIDDLT